MCLLTLLLLKNDFIFISILQMSCKTCKLNLCIINIQNDNQDFYKVTMTSYLNMIFQVSWRGVQSKPNPGVVNSIYEEVILFIRITISHLLYDNVMVLFLLILSRKKEGREKVKGHYKRWQIRIYNFHDTGIFCRERLFCIPESFNTNISHQLFNTK